jgi:hypothetical protein
VADITRIVVTIHCHQILNRRSALVPAAAALLATLHFAINAIANSAKASTRD